MLRTQTINAHSTEYNFDMKKNKLWVLLLIACFAISALLYSSFFNPNSEDTMEVPDVQASEKFPGGDGSVSTKPFPSFMLAMENMHPEILPEFHAGKALAHQPWVTAPTITFDRDGLGPIYNARTCLMCHVNGGRGVMPTKPDHGLNTGFLRLSIPGEDKIHGVIPEPTYGDQLQSQSVSLKHQLRHLKNNNLVHTIPPEAYLYIDWPEHEFVYPDGSKVKLRKPNFRVENLGYGPMHPDTMMGLRNAPPILGVGLLETIPQSAIEALVDENDQNGDGISGRQNYVWDFEAEKTVPGRFGLKANKASVRLQTAGAFHGDMGISNPVFPDQPCTENQKKCLQQPTGNDKAGTEIPENQLTMVINFTKGLGVPIRRNADSKSVLAGREHFYQAGCASCHQPNFKTAEDKEFPHLSEQVIWPYTDLLLHDMGPELADGRPDYLATGSEWRTPPLWGLGLSKKVNGAQNFLHDGRARTIEEAILWHGGEAEAAKQNFIHLSKQQRENLTEFVNSL